MRILYITPYTPNRIRVRPYQLLRTLVEAGHTVTLGTVWSSQAERADMEELRASGIEVVAAHLPASRSLFNTLQSLPTAQPLQVAFCWQPELARRLARLAMDTPFDAVHVEHLRGARYGLYLKAQLAATGIAPPIVWDSVDCITQLFRQASAHSGSLKGRLITRFELGRTSRFEPWLLTQFNRTLVTSPTDRAALIELATGMGLAHVLEAIHVLPNGVDLEYFVPGVEPRLPATLVLSGKMSYHANVTAAQHLVREIMPRIWVTRPDVQVWIVGKDPPREVLALAQDAGTARVMVTGTVPDIRVYLQQATIAVAPVPYGAGIQNKVLEAMACGAPVVASQQAVSALSAEHGQDLLVAGASAEFAQEILSLLDTPMRRRELSRAGRTYVENNHSWPQIGTDLEQVYSALRRRNPHTQFQHTPAFAL